MGHCYFKMFFSDQERFSKCLADTLRLKCNSEAAEFLQEYHVSRLPASCTLCRTNRRSRRDADTFNGCNNLDSSEQYANSAFVLPNRGFALISFAFMMILSAIWDLIQMTFKCVMLKGQFLSAITRLLDLKDLGLHLHICLQTQMK